MITIKLEDVGAGESRLLCPGCGESWMHHATVGIGVRREDQPGVRVTVDPIDVDVRIQPETRFRGRRHEVVVECWCERCEFGGRLILRQHKGSTLLGWERDDRIRQRAVDAEG